MAYVDQIAKNEAEALKRVQQFVEGTLPKSVVAVNIEGDIKSLARHSMDDLYWGPRLKALMPIARVKLQEHRAEKATIRAEAKRRQAGNRVAQAGRNREMAKSGGSGQKKK